MTKLTNLPGVQAVERLAEIETTLPNGSLAFVRAEDRPTFPFPVLAGQSPQRSIDANQLIIGGILARQNGIRVGDTVLLGSGAAATKVVVGTILATPEVGGRRIQMSYRLAEQIFGPEPAALVFLQPAPGSSVPALGDELAGQVFNQQVRATDSAGYEQTVASGEARFLTPLNALKYGLLAIAFISVSSTLLLTGMARRREVALIQALGAAPAKVFAVTAAEAVIASLVGALFSAALSVGILDAIRRAAIVDVGSDSPLVFPLSQALLYAVLAASAAILAALIPAWRSTRTAPSTALRDE
jgi:putative ABC transport system permease protein